MDSSRVTVVRATSARLRTAELVPQPPVSQPKMSGRNRSTIAGPPFYLLMESRAEMLDNVVHVPGHVLLPPLRFQTLQMRIKSVIGLGNKPFVKLTLRTPDWSSAFIIWPLRFRQQCG